MSSAKPNARGSARRARTGIAAVSATACLLAATGSVAASAATTTRTPLSTTGVTAAGDAYTVETMPNMNTGGALKLVTGTPTDGEKTSYVEFNAGPLATGSRAQLVVDVPSANGGTLAVYATSASWSESTITAANAPANGTLLGKATVPTTSTPVKVTVDLGTYSRTDGVYSFVLVRQGTVGGVFRMSSTEAGTAVAPRLKATAPTTSPSPTPTATTASPSPTPTKVSPSPTPTATTASPSPTPTATTASPSPTPTSTTTSPAPVTPACAVSAKLVPSCGAWFGVGAVPLNGETFDQALVDFETAAQRPMDIAHYYTKGQNYVWPTKGMMLRATEPGKNRILFVNWRPDGLTWAQVADGAADAYLVKLAAHIKATHPRPFFLSLNAEMEDEVNETAGSGQTAADFRDYYRHVILKLRAEGATNVVSTVVYLGAPHWGDKPWFETLYPGNDVVDWVGQDPYAFGKPPIWLSDYATLVNRIQNPVGSTWPGFYEWAKRKGKPQMLAEWGVHESPEYPTYKTSFWPQAQVQMKNFPEIKALVYWNSPEHPVVGVTRVDSSAGSLANFRIFAADPYLNQAGEYYLKR